jgi:hypothetical protein
MNMDIFDKLESSWPSPVVARSEVGRFSGGLLNPKTLANRDSLGEGPKERVRVGRKIGYTAHSLAEWMRSQANKDFPFSDKDGDHA